MVWPFVAIAVGGAAIAGRRALIAARQNRVPERMAESFKSYSAVLGSFGSGFSWSSLTGSKLQGFENPMSTSEAYRILNVNPTSDKNTIRDHHRQLMRRNHPDNGGSTLIASKVNEAKELLLGN
eukprot:GDKH01002106.1.p1 GENE.GDKH01002106.1~~GDKH01002106.1.p1  ORF type:complete len:124 (+),score=22.81 GDKH01002106.1:73-444(+)